MNDENKKNNEFSELDNETNNDESGFEEFKPDASAYQAEQEALKDVHKNKEKSEQEQEISEEDKRFAPGYQEDSKENVEEPLEQEKANTEEKEVIIEEVDDENDRYKPAELRKNIETEEKEEKPKEKAYYGKDEPFSQYEPTFDETELEPVDEADFEDPVEAMKNENQDIDSIEEEPEEKQEEKKTVPPKIKSTYNARKPLPELDDETKIYAGICHLTTVLGFTALWLPIIFFFIKNDDEDIRFHAKQATVTGFIFLLLIGVLTFVLFIVQCLCCLSPFILLALFTVWCYAAYVSYMVFTGIDYRIPFICDIVEDTDF